MVICWKGWANWEKQSAIRGTSDCSFNAIEIEILRLKFVSLDNDDSFLGIQI